MSAAAVRGRRELQDRVRIAAFLARKWPASRACNAQCAGTATLLYTPPPKTAALKFRAFYCCMMLMSMQRLTRAWRVRVLASCVDFRTDAFAPFLCNCTVSRGHTPLDWALVWEHRHVADVLRTHGVSEWWLKLCGACTATLPKLQMHVKMPLACHWHGCCCSARDAAAAHPPLPQGKCSGMCHLEPSDL